MNETNVMTPLQALELISKNIARLTGSRNDHAVLMRAEAVIREALMKVGNGPHAVEMQEDTKMPAPANN